MALWTELVLLSLIVSPDPGGPDECLNCHDIATPKVNLEHRASIHFETDVTCAACHGGDPDAREEKAGHAAAKKFRGKFSRPETLRMCGECHSDVEKMKFFRVDTNVLREYQTSQHGELLAKGDKNVAICTSCHGVHKILPKDNPESPVYRLKLPDTCGECHSDPKLMKPYKIPTDQVDEYKNGIHGEILYGKRPSPRADDVPVCADCHGIHGARPAEVSQVPKVCGTCHREVYRHLRTSAHREALLQFDEPECTDCHGNHRNSIPPGGLFTRPPATPSGRGAAAPAAGGRVTGNAEAEGNCQSCHDEDEEKVMQMAKDLQTAADQAEALGARFDKAVDTYRDQPEAARFLDGEAEEVREARLKVLRATHSLDVGRVQVQLGEAKALVEGTIRFAERVILKKPESPAVVFLLIGVTVGGLFVVSTLVAVGLIRRWRRR
ncbi:MAG: cytochrome c3 family protein [Nitrospirae bacterium]|nr:cytochrome c3 family protein [Nitrospirota bacterium]